jgi:predicted glycosyltransferase
MKILIDIGHPAHVHYFKNFIWDMEKRGHEFVISARDKEVAHQLLNAYKINFNSRGSGGKGIFNKLIYFFEGDFKIYKLVKAFKPNLLLSFASPYLAHISKLTGIPHIVLDDTENNKWNHRLYAPFSTVILTPSCFSKNLGVKQIFFNSYMELCYLHPNYFKPDINILQELRLKLNEKFLIIRFVSWQATHDTGHKGISLANKIKVVKEFEKYARVFISSEAELPPELSSYKINIAPHSMHNAIAFSYLLFGESATMSSEAAVLGTPAIYLDNIGRGYTDEEEKKYGLVFNYTESGEDQWKAIEKGVEILNTQGIKEEWQRRRQKMLADKIDVMAFLVWFVENYPKSVKVMSENPDYQYNFK